MESLLVLVRQELPEQEEPSRAPFLTLSLVFARGETLSQGNSNTVSLAVLRDMDKPLRGSYWSMLSSWVKLIISLSNIIVLTTTSEGALWRQANGYSTKERNTFYLQPFGVYVASLFPCAIGALYGDRQIRTSMFDSGSVRTKLQCYCSTYVWAGFIKIFESTWIAGNFGYCFWSLWLFALHWARTGWGTTMAPLNMDLFSMQI